MPADLTRAIEEAHVIMLTGPVDLDGDAVGAIVALARAIEERWPDKRIRVIADEQFPARYDFLEGARERFECARNIEVEGDLDLAIVLDGDPHRLGTAEAFFRSARQTGQVDHHISSDPSDVDAAFIDAHAASTTLMVLDLCDEWGVEVDRHIAAAIYAGLIFDTNTFRYQNTHPETLRAGARLMDVGIDHVSIVERVLLDQPLSKQMLRGHVLERMAIEAGGRFAWSLLHESETRGVETGGLVDDLVFIEGVEVAALFVERAGGVVKVSMRSRGDVDVCAVCQTLTADGGGHRRAAGARLSGSVEAVAARGCRQVLLALEAAAA